MDVINEFFECKECGGRDFLRIYHFSLRFHSVNFSDSLVYDRLVDEVYQCNNCKKTYSIDEIDEVLEAIKARHKNTGLE
jgi:DNA-directed RNA polymerase subunit RPC12/RpoP